MTTNPTFAVITGEQVSDTLRGREAAVVDLVREAYLVHEDGLTVNPPSHFLRFPDRPAARIIALPASLGGAGGVDGVKWISSVPSNVDRGLPRASAVTILNDPTTGYPYACLESSILSATRTAASAVLAAQVLSAGRARPRRLGIVGTGLIARYVHQYLAATGWELDEIGVCDVSPEHAREFTGYLGRAVPETPVVLHDDASDLVRSSDLVVFATVAPAPHVHSPSAFAHGPIVLGVSLRDVSPAVVLAAHNVVDDVEHVLTAGTSVHLAEQESRSRDFVAGTLAQVVRGDVGVPRDGTVLFSPFGLGVLDLALARYVHDELDADGRLLPVDRFFHELDRMGA